MEPGRLQIYPQYSKEDLTNELEGPSNTFCVWRESVNAVLQNPDRHWRVEKHSAEKKSVPPKPRIDLHGQPKNTFLA